MIFLPKKFDRSDIENLIAESFLFKRFKLLMINQFEWEGLDEIGVKEKHLEEYLFETGRALLVKDPELDFLCLYGSGIGKPNVNGDHVKFRANGFGYSKIFKAEKCVLIENNKLRMPTCEALTYFVYKLYTLSRASDVNANQLKLQTLFTANDKNILTVKKIIDEIDKNNWAIITDATMSLEDIVKAIQTGVKCMLPELRDEYNAVLNEALTYFGINNSNTDKRERLINAEANANNQFIDSCVDIFLESRQKACEEIKEKFNVEISVKLRNERKEVVANVEHDQTTDSE